jgi:hypothetical protein
LTQAAGRRSRWSAAGLTGLILLTAACSGIPSFPGTGPPPATSTATLRPAEPTPNLQATIDTAVAATSQARSAAQAPVPTGGAQAAPPTATPTSGPGDLAAGALTAVATLIPLPAGSPAATSTPVSVGQGAAAPEEAVRRAYEAAVAGDDRALAEVTDPEQREQPAQLRAVELLGRTGRRLTLHDMAYIVEANDGSTATVHVTGRIGNLPIVGERSIDERESVRKIGAAWYLSRPRDNRSG